MMSSKNTLSPPDLKAARLIGEVREQLQLAYLEELADRRLKKSDIARLLNIHRSVISRLLNGKAALDLKSIAYLSWAFKRDVQFSLPRRKVRSGKSNRPVYAPPNALGAAAITPALITSDSP